MATTNANTQTHTLPSQFPLRTNSASQSTLRRSSDVGRTSSSGGPHNSGPPHHMIDNTQFGDATTLKGDYSGNNSPHTPFPDDVSPAPKLRKVSSTLEGHRAWLGLQPMAPVQEDHDHAAHNHLGWSKVKIVLKEPLAEFWGTFIFVLFGKNRCVPINALETNRFKAMLV